MTAKKLGKYLAIAVTAVFMQTAFAAEPVTVTISCGSRGMDYDFCEQNTQEWSNKTGNKVKLITPSASGSADTLRFFRTKLSERSPNLDVMMTDIVWTGLLKDHLLDLTPASRNVASDHFPSLIANNTVNGKLLAMPWFIEAGLLYYRKDLLEKYGEKVPSTWAEMTATAKRIQTAERRAGRSNMYGFVFQGRPYEGLTIDALEWVASHNGGTFVNDQGEITINNPQAAQALDMAASWVGNIAPASVLNSGEEEARAIFMKGNAVFMRNWAYAWSLSQTDDSTLRGKVGVTVLPKGGESGQSAAGTGGWQLAVSKYSRHPEEAVDLVMFLTSKEVQKQRAILGSYQPTIRSLYRDQDILREVPFIASQYPTFANTVNRPATTTADKYNEVSEVIWETSHQVLTKKVNGQQAVEKMEKQLKEIRGSGW